MKLINKIKRLKSLLRSYQSVVVAFSGGVDSSVLLKISREILGEKVLAVTIASGFQTQEELNFAKFLAKKLAVKHIVVKHDVLRDKNVQRNPRQRCYFCKKEIMKILIKIAANYGFNQIAEGSNVDDTKLFRPGKRALKELDIKSPLALAGLEKREIRQLAKKIGLKNWAEPSASCLATRIPYGESLTKGKLKQISMAEAILRNEGFDQIRVRRHGKIARIEVNKADIGRLVRIFNPKLAKKLKKTGFKYVCLDLQGYRSGSMDAITYYK